MKDSEPRRSHRLLVFSDAPSDTLATAAALARALCADVLLLEPEPERDGSGSARSDLVERLSAEGLSVEVERRDAAADGRDASIDHWLAERGVDLVVCTREASVESGTVAAELFGREPASLAIPFVVVCPPASDATDRSEPARRFRRVLVPTDLSENDRSVLSTVGSIAEAFAPELLFYLVVPEIDASAERERDAPASSGASSPGKDFAAEVRERSRWCLETRVRRALGQQATFSPIVEDGEPGRQIVAKARELGAELLVIGSGDGDAGSVAREVLQRADCPVLCVRPQTPAAGS